MKKDSVARRVGREPQRDSATSGLFEAGIGLARDSLDEILINGSWWRSLGGSDDAKP